jgi:hypothetical protein
MGRPFGSRGAKTKTPAGLRDRQGRARKWPLTDLLRKFPVICLEFLVLQKNFPDSLLREFAEKSLRHSGFLL